jgi:hypothetical protein
MPIERRVQVWLTAVKQFFSEQWSEKVFEIYEDGVLHPFVVIKGQSDKE